MASALSAFPEQGLYDLPQFEFTLHVKPLEVKACLVLESASLGPPGLASDFEGWSGCQGGGDQGSWLDLFHCLNTHPPQTYVQERTVETQLPIREMDLKACLDPFVTSSVWRITYIGRIVEHMAHIRDYLVLFPTI